MAFNNQDNNKKKYYEPTLHSPYNTSNTDGVDPSALSYSFFNGLLKISMSPMKPGAKPDDYNIWDHENAVSVWITHTKARMLLDEIEYVMNNLDTVNNSGVNTGSDGLVSFSSGKELGASSPCLIIRKVNQETGEVMSTYAYQFKTSHHKVIRNFDPAHPTEFDSYVYANLEIEQLKTVLREYYVSICGAQCYANMYGGRYDTNRMNTKIGLIMDKLGIESSADYSSRSNRSNQSFFASNSGRTSSESYSTGMSIEDMEASMNDD